MLARAYQDGRLGLVADPEQAKYWYDKANSGS
jgi:TPR repeat protein